MQSLFAFYLIIFKSNNKPHNKQKVVKNGFTLIETLIVVGIIGILMLLVTQVGRKAKLKSMIEAERAQIAKYINALQVFYDKHHEYPPNESTEKSCTGSECLFEYSCKTYKYKAECDPGNPDACVEKVDDPIIPPASLLSWEFEGRKKPTSYTKPNKIFDIFGTELQFISPGKARPDKSGPPDFPDIFSCGVNKRCESKEGACQGDDICSWNAAQQRK